MKRKRRIEIALSADDARSTGEGRTKAAANILSKDDIARSPHQVRKIPDIIRETLSKK